MTWTTSNKVGNCLHPPHPGGGPSSLGACKGVAVPAPLLSAPCGTQGVSCRGGRKFPTKSQPEEKQEETLAVDTPWEGGKGEKKPTCPAEQEPALCLNPHPCPSAGRPASSTLPSPVRASTSSVTWLPAQEQQTPAHMHTDQSGPTRPPCGSSCADTHARTADTEGDRPTPPSHRVQSQTPSGIMGNMYQIKLFKLHTRPPPQKGIPGTSEL